MKTGSSGGDGRDVRGSVSGGEGSFEGGQAGAECKAAGAKGFEYELFFAIPDQGRASGITMD